MSYKKGPRFGPNSHLKMIYAKLEEKDKKQVAEIKDLPTQKLDAKKEDPVVLVAEPLEAEIPVVEAPTAKIEDAAKQEEAPVDHKQQDKKKK